MKERKFFPKRPNLHPKVYAFKDNNPNYKGFLKIGYTHVMSKSVLAKNIQ